MLLPHFCLKYVEKNHTLLKVGLWSGFIHWHSYVFCLIFSVIPNVDSSFFPLPLIWCSQGVFFKDHMKRVYSLWKCLGLCFCSFQCCYRSMSEGTAWHLYIWSCYLPHFEHCANILWLTVYQKQNHKREVLHSWTFSFQWCITVRATCCWLLQLSSSLQSPRKLLTSETSCCKCLLTFRCTSKGCAAFWNNLVAVMESSNLILHSLSSP